MKEWLTDREKRILLSALTREKKVCKKVDEETEPKKVYEESLEYVCNSLEYKFYYDRLFKDMEKEIRADEREKVIKITWEFAEEINTFETYRNEVLKELGENKNEM